MVQERDWDDCLSRLSRVDAVAAAKMSPYDWGRMEKALAYLLSGRNVISAKSPVVEGDLQFVPIILEQAHELRYEALAQQAHQHIQEGLVEECVRLLPLGLEDSVLARHAGYRQAVEYIQQQWITSFPKSKQSRRRGLEKLTHMYFRALRLQSDKHWKILRKSFPDAPRVRVDGRDHVDVAEEVALLWERATSAVEPLRVGVEDLSGDQGIITAPSLDADGDFALHYLSTHALERGFLEGKERELHAFMQAEGVISENDDLPRTFRRNQDVYSNRDGSPNRLSKGERRLRRWQERQTVAQHDEW